MTVTGILTATEATLGSIGISTGRITGPAITYIDPATVGDDTGTLVVKGNLQVDGTTTTVNSTTLTVTDKNIEIAKGQGNDAAVDGAGITVDSSDGDKTWNWVDATDSWTSSEHIRIPDGKVFGFATDTNTYIGRPAADTIAFTHGGGEKVRITSDGSVGIGTTNPDTLLHIKGSSVTQKLITLNSIHERNNYIGVYENDNLEIAADEDNQGASSSIRFRIDGSEKVRITSDGEVGIGTLTTSDFLLKVQGSTRVVGNVVSTGSSTTGISTVVGVGTFKDDVYIDKKLYVGGIEIGGPLSLIHI